MTIQQIREMISGEEYDFLRTNEHLGSRIIFLTLGGSYSYGTNVEGSDVDVRGCALSRPSDLLGLSNFEQVVHTETDTTVYSFNKLVSLLLNCNPNTIEMLGCRPEHYFLLTPIGKEMIENRKLFLSRRAVHSFGGYATQQLRRLENALARDRLSQAEKEEHILKSMQSAVQSFKSRYTSFEYGSMALYTAESGRDDLDKEIFADIHIDKYPVREFNGVINELTSIVGVYEKLNHRNHKKDETHLNKHAMHLIRLYLMCLDILEKQDIITYRENDRDLLLRIRNGEYQREDGTYRNEFFEMVNDFEARLFYAKENTSLPEHPDMKRIEEFVMAVNRRALCE
ncbi:MAG: nucleotidyltransferase domain-containing protein [Ruminococcus flavefaciens]|nr:nucleotidyltransferase domain-containing protein [Ruminococcus flavefaciens]